MLRKYEEIKINQKGKTMNFIKTSIPKTEYKEVEKLGGKHILHMLPEEDGDSYLCVECMTDHEPTTDEFNKIKLEAGEYLERLQKKSDVMNFNREVADLKQKLSETDYIAIKYAEGWISAEDYAATKAQRQQWRDRINELQQEAETVE